MFQQRLATARWKFQEAQKSHRKKALTHARVQEACGAAWPSTWASTATTTLHGRAPAADLPPRRTAPKSRKGPLVTLTSKIQDSEGQETCDERVTSTVQQLLADHDVPTVKRQCTTAFNGRIDDNIKSEVKLRHDTTSCFDDEQLLYIIVPGVRTCASTSSRHQRPVKSRPRPVRRAAN